MDTEIDLTAADHDVLISVIAELPATVLEQRRVIERCERRIAELEGQIKPGGPSRMPGLKTKSGRQPPAQQEPSKQRRHGFARPRLTPTHRVEHVVENCPDCGTQLSGGWTQRTREVIELPLVPAQVTEHVYIARTCPVCQQRRLPQAELDGVVMGRQRLGSNVISLIVISLITTLREAGRLPIRSIQWYLRTVHQLHLSVGAIVNASHQTAHQAQPAVAELLDRIRASPVVHADETGWREDGSNGYVWTFSTPTERYFRRRGRGKAIVAAALGDSFSGVLVSDFYAAYHHYDGSQQRCWAHLLRDSHDLRTLYPHDEQSADEQSARWADALHRLYTQAKRRRAAQLALERRLLAIGQPFLNDPSAPPSRLCRRIKRPIKELFILVAGPDVPPDNNAAARSLRHLVISRKVSGRTRSQRGSNSKMTLASLFDTWRARRMNPIVACRQLLSSPQP